MGKNARPNMLRADYVRQSPRAACLPPPPGVCEKSVPRPSPCDNCGHRHGEAGAPATCPDRESHPDGQLPPRDDAGNPVLPPHCMGESVMSGTPGRATAKGNNCLIHSLAQLVHGDFDFDAPGKRICHDAYCERVRAHLSRDRGCDPQANVDFELWAAPIIAAFDQ